MKRFEGKTIIITGAASGLGLTAAQHLSDEGANLVLVDLKTEALEAARDSLANSSNALCVAANVSDLEQVKLYVSKALDAYGRIDGFFNNAGIEGKQNLTEEFGEDEFSKVVG